MKNLPKGIDHGFRSKCVVHGVFFASGKLQFPLKLLKIVLELAVFIGIDVLDTLIFPAICGIKKDNGG